jgi:hypothetical protein
MTVEKIKLFIYTAFFKQNKQRSFMKNVLLASLLIFGSTTSFAAKFKAEEKLKSVVLEQLAEAVKPELDKLGQGISFDVSGDIQDIEKYSFSRKATESNRSTMKQLAIGRLGQTPDDEEGDTAYEIATQSVSEMVDSMLFPYVGEYADFYDDEDAAQVEKLYNSTAEKIYTILNSTDSSQIKVFGGNHSYEDGTWGILIILDEKTQEILAFRVGYSGT